MEKLLLPKDKNGDSDNSHLFGYIINIMRLARSNDWNEFKNELIAMYGKYSFVDMSYYGFCDDWYNKLL